jgi:hypothetical protein
MKLLFSVRVKSTNRTVGLFSRVWRFSETLREAHASVSLSPTSGRKLAGVLVCGRKDMSPDLQFQLSGPRLQLYVGVSHPRLQALQQAGLAVPAPALIRGLFDTGASTTATDPTVIQGLGIKPTGSMQIVTPSTGVTPVQVNTFDVGIIIPLGTAGQNHVISALQVFESSLTVQGIQALIGRDVLINSL